jgi:hypothetical protein
VTPICFVDCETDGVHPSRKPWEIAIIRRDDSGERTFQCFVDIDLSTADPFGLRIGRFHERHPLGRYLASHDEDEPEALYVASTDQGEYLTRYAAACQVVRFTHGAHWVGAVPNFDTETLAALLRGERLTPAWHYHLVDVEALAVGYLNSEAQRDVSDIAAGGADRPTLPWKSDELSLACGVQPPSEQERHTALGDCRWAQRLYDVITRGT